MTMTSVTVGARKQSPPYLTDGKPFSASREVGGVYVLGVVVGG